MWSGGTTRDYGPPSPHLPPFVFPPPALSCPDASLGRGEEEAALSARVAAPPRSRSDSNRNRSSTQLHPHQSGPSRSPAIRAEGDKQKVCRCPKPPTPLTGEQETGSGLAAILHRGD